MKQIIVVLLTIMSIVVFGQDPAKQKNKTINQDTLATYRFSVEANPNDLSLHKKFIKYLGISSEEIEIQYLNWCLKFPKSANVPFSIGEAYANMESPKAKPWLLKASEIDPKMAQAWFLLWIDGERWGDFSASREFLKRAMEAEPKNPDYAFYYRSSFKSSDPKKYRQGMSEMPQLFPASERGAQSLYWLGLFVKDSSERLEIYSQLRKNYPPEKSNWSSSGMYDFYYLYLQLDPLKAIELANAMDSITTQENEKKNWILRTKLAKDIVVINSLMANNKIKEAKDLAENVVLERRSKAADRLNLLRAQLTDLSGKTQDAYGRLIKYYAVSPGDEVMEALNGYAKKIGKNRSDIYKDIWKIRDSTAVQATNFSLGQYFVPDSASLSDFKGKVVLLTYWFPGCGPCRGEFPNFENVIRKFSKEQVAYIGINIQADQDVFVVPFMKSSGYSFIPLKGVKEKQGNLVAIGAPTNYLMDQNGRIIFKNFRVDNNNERVLEIMIEEMLERGKNL